MNFLLVTHGIPNKNSEQANCDPLLFLENLKKKGHTVNVVSIYNKNYFSSNLSQNFYLRNLKKKYKSNFFFINTKYKSFYNLIKNKLYNTFKYQISYENNIDQIRNELKKKINISKPDCIINFFDVPIVLTGTRPSEKKIPIVNYIGVYKKNLEKLKIKIYLSESITNYWRIFTSLFYVYSVEKFYKKYLNLSTLNLCPARDTYEELGKLKIKNLILTRPLSQPRKKKPINLGDKKKILIIGNLRSTFMKEVLLDLSNNLIQDIKNLREKNNFEIHIVGKFDPENNIRKKLNFPWIKFRGWVKNSDMEYKNSDILFVPNKTLLAPRTKILEAMSCGICVVTYKSNVYSHPEFKNYKNILYGTNKNQIIHCLKIALGNNQIQKKIYTNSKKLYKKKYHTNKVMLKNIKLIIQKIKNA